MYIIRTGYRLKMSVLLDEIRRTVNGVKQHPIALQHESDPELHQASFFGDCEKLVYLLEDEKHRELLNYRNRLGCTPLRLAATVGNARCVEVLLEEGADINVTDVKGQTPLYVAVKNKHLQVIQILLEAGANPDGDLQCLCSPIYTAAFEGFLPGLQELVMHGADLNKSRLIMNNIGATPLYISLSYHHFNCFKHLLLTGADPDIIIKDQLNLNEALRRPVLSLYHSAIKHNVEVEYAELLYLCGAGLYYKDDKGRLPCDIDTINECSQYMKTLYDTPKTLSQQCRIVIRGHLQEILQLKFIYLLPLPSALINYLSHK